MKVPNNPDPIQDKIIQTKKMDLINLLEFKLNPAAILNINILKIRYAINEPPMKSVCTNGEAGPLKNIRGNNQLLILSELKPIKYIAIENPT